jgi:hypothetical protein
VFLPFCHFFLSLSVGLSNLTLDKPTVPFQPIPARHMGWVVQLRVGQPNRYLPLQRI